MTSTAVKKARREVDEKYRKTVGALSALKSLEPPPGPTSASKSLEHMHHDAWAWQAIRHSNTTVVLARHGWKGSHAYYTALEKAHNAAENALFWAPLSPALHHLVNKIKDALTTRNVSCPS